MLDKVKQYLKIDTNAEDNYLNSLIKATEIYISSSCDEEYVKNELAENTQLMLIGTLYNNRAITDSKGNKILKTIFDAMMIKIKTMPSKEVDSNGNITNEK